jgi:hypothetical protein
MHVAKQLQEQVLLLEGCWEAAHAWPHAQTAHSPPDLHLTSTSLQQAASRLSYVVQKEI